MNVYSLINELLLHDPDKEVWIADLEDAAPDALPVVHGVREEGSKRVVIY